MATATKKEETSKLKEIPGFSRKVRLNSATRMIKLAQPICPYSAPRKVTRDTDGRLREEVRQPHEVNCQTAEGEWWVDCAERGHDPYFRTQKWYTTEDKLEPELDADGNETGRLLKTGEVIIPHELRQPNIAQVAISIRINSGRGAQRKIERHGFKRLSEVGYAEVCQFRNCQKLTVPKFTSRKYGAFCSADHQNLSVADAETIMLNYVNQRVNGPETDKVIKARERKLREAALMAQAGDL